MAQQRIWFAEDIAHAMERLDEIREGAKRLAGSVEKVAAEFGMEPASFKAMLHNARTNGFEHYPMRNES